MVTLAQRNIAAYKPQRDAAGNYGVFTLQCFVGMIETGESTYDDFQAVGGDELAAAVANTKRHMDESRKGYC